MTQLVALLTCHNRKEQTLECLRALFTGGGRDDVQVSAVLIDDGSTDGTSDAVNASFPRVVLERGNGSLFWNRGMHRAHQVAARSDPDFLLWLNDDTIVAPDALSGLLSTFDKLKTTHGREVVVVGTTVDIISGELTYGGLVAESRLRQFNFRKVRIGCEPRECEAMNGNIVLIPRAIYQRIGPLDPVFEHALGDIDYALRVRKAGFRVFVAPGVQGNCSANIARGTHLDSSLPVWERWTKFKGRKGLPFSSWRHFVRQHAGWLWPLYLVVPYLNFGMRLIRDRLLMHVGGLSR